MIDWTEILDGDTWEHFARDFLKEMGFKIEVEPGRGPDRGRDIVVSEQVQGILHGDTFRWLVSCKHNAAGGTSVGTEEGDIGDRCRRNQCGGFMGFYSTVASAALIDRLEELKRERAISDYRVFNSRTIEGQIIARGMTKISLRYIPRSYGTLRPIQKFFNDYVELKCATCHEDVLSTSVTEHFTAIAIFAEDQSGIRQEIHIAHKGKCDENLTRRLTGLGYVTGWQDVTDLTNPLIYLHYIMGHINQLQAGEKFSEQAHEFTKSLILALAQRTLRDVTKEDEERYALIKSLEGL